MESNQIKINNDNGFVIHYCELQSWGEMHRCKTKVLNQDIRNSSVKNYKTMIGNLRMSTKYSFNVRPKKRDEKMGRPETKDYEQGQTIIVPTKGFSAVATKCLPNESEIEIETGPYFSGKITSENGLCAITGDSKDPHTSYIMRIDHEKCGSNISPDDLTVETYITVQESSNILTHSTRKFIVICTYQPDTLTVRARLALPSKSGAIVMEEERDHRNARERQFKMVNRSALVLKEESIENAVGDIDNLTEKIISLESSQQLPRDSGNEFEMLKDVRFSRFSAVSEKSAAILSEFESFVGLTIGCALVTLFILIFIYVFKADNGQERNIKFTN